MRASLNLTGRRSARNPRGLTFSSLTAMRRETFSIAVINTKEQ
jgi:hypothetical protein